MITITFEGQDQIGKADVVSRLSKYLISEGFSVYNIAYPYYSLPFGYLTSRYFKDIENFRSIDRINKISGTSRELEIVGFIFALNRLETLPLFSEIEEKNFLLADRGPYSLAVTLSYGLVSKIIAEEDIDRLIELYLEFDSHFRKILETDKLVIQLLSNGDIKNVAAGKRQQDINDVYETSDVQKITREVYSQYAKLIPGWNKVVTRYDGDEKPKWRDREQIRKDGYLDVKKIELAQPENISIRDLAEVQYGVKIDKANEILLNNAFDKGDKSKIDKISPSIAKKIAKNTSSEKIGWDKQARANVGKFLDQYPELLDICSNYLGDSFSEAFRRSV